MKPDLKSQETLVAPLEKGQIWMLENECLEIKHVGKHLVEFLLTKKQPARRARAYKQMESIKTVLTFLQTHHAELGCSQ